MTKRARLISLVVIFIYTNFLLSGCASQLSFRFTKDKALAQRISSYIPQYPVVKFMVISDLHYFDPQLGIEGKAFAEYLDQDRKLLAYSKEPFLLSQAILQKMVKDTTTRL